MLVNFETELNGPSYESHDDGMPSKRKDAQVL